MFALAYPARFRPDEDNRPVVSFPDFVEARTDGATQAEAMAQAIDCLGSVIAFSIAERLDIPKPSAPKRGQKLVPVPLWIAGKLALYLAIREQGISQSDLARRLGVRETVVRRMLDPDHDTRLEKIQEALDALGKRVVFGLEDAA